MGHKVNEFTRVGGAPGATITYTAARRTVYCTTKPGGVAADAATEISAETAALIAGSNEDLVS